MAGPSVPHMCLTARPFVPFMPTHTLVAHESPVTMYLLPLTIILLLVTSTYGRDERRDSSSWSQSGRCARDGGECRPLESSTCLDVTLPYKHTSFYSSAFESQAQVHQYLEKFTGLRKVPRCWTAFESMICTLLLPRCDVQTQQTFLPTQELCRNAKNHCKIIEPFITSLCSNQTLFPSSCENRYRDLKFLNPSPAKCLSPVLVSSEDSNIWFPGIDGCAYNCSDPRYSERDKSELDLYIFYASLAGLLMTASSCLTIHISRPILPETAAILYQCLCMFMVSCGFFTLKKFSQKEDIVCRPDSSLRYSEPGSSNENRWLCICSFLFIYYFTIAAFVWRVNLSLAFSQKYALSKAKTMGSRKTKATYQHLAAWSIPIMLIIMITCINEIDASFLIGICFVGFNNLTARLIFVLVPNAISAVVSCFFLSLCLQPLLQARRTVCASKDATALRHESAKKAEINSFINKIITQITLIIVFEIVFLLVVIYANIYELVNSRGWSEDLKSSVICSMNVTDLSLPGAGAIESPYQCNEASDKSFPWAKNQVPFSEKPASLKHVYMQFACILFWSLIISSWTWRRDSLMAWRRRLLRLLHAPNVEDPKFVRAHQILAEAYGKYKNNNENDAVAVSIQYNDPLGLNLTSVASNEISTTFLDELNNLLNAPKVSRSSRKSRAITSRLSKRSLRSFFTGDKNGDGSSISDVSVFRSNVANSSVAESMGMGSMGNSRVSQEDIREMQETIKIQRKKTRRCRDQYKEMSSRPYRRVVDTSTQSQEQARSISAQAANGTAHQPVTEPHNQQRSPPALSPELLVQMQYNALLQQAIAQQNQYLMPQTMASVLPFPPLTSLSKQAPMLQPRPYEPPSSSLRERVKPKVRPNVSNASTEFSHGMTEQTIGMHNPLTEGRRADSRVPYHDPNFQVVVASSINPMLLNSSPYRHMMQNGIGHAVGNQFLNFMSPNQGMISGNLATTAFNSLPTVPGPKTEAELQNLMRERAECIALVAPVDSGSEFGDSVMSIAMSDSEAICTDGETATVASKASNNSNLLIQKAVTERIQKIEAQAAASKIDSEDETNEAKLCAATVDASHS